MGSLVSTARVVASYVPWLFHLLYYRVSDPCADAGSSQVVPYAWAVACYGSFPLIHDREQGIVDTLAKASMLDAQGRDVRPMLKAVLAQGHRTEHGFHRALTRAYNHLQDRTYTYSSQCFATFEFVLPYSLGLFGDTLRIVSHPRHPRLLAGWGVQEFGYSGAPLLAINGIPAWEYLARYALDHVGATPDPDARLALVLARARLRSGSWQVEEGAFARTRVTPEHASLKLTIRHGNATLDIDAPYLAISPSGFDSRASFYEQNCLAIRPVTSQFTAEMKLAEDRSIARFASISAHSTGRGGILNIEQFAREGAEAQLRDAMRALQALEGTHLLVDVSNAGGEGLCFARLLTKALFNRHLAFGAEMRHNRLLDLMLDRNVSNPLLHAYTAPEGAGVSLNYLTTKYHYPGDPESFTPPLLDACPATPYPSARVPPRIGVIANGNCVGACALFVYHASQVPGVTIFKVKTLESAPLVFASSVDSFDAAAVVASLDPFRGIPSTNFLPRPFPVPIRCMVSGRRAIVDRVRRVLSVPAHHYIATSPSEIPFDVWERASSIMHRLPRH